MNIHHLELFYHVARNGGITEAVRNMPYGIQQPAVSGQILQLEEDLGTRLFQRRPFQLTNHGAELYAFISPFFENVDHVGERLRGGAAQTIRMAGPQVALRDHLPAILVSLRKTFPKMKLHLREAHQPQVQSWLERQEVDLAITVLEEKPPAGIQSEPLMELEVGFHVPARSRWEKADDLIAKLASGSELPPLITLPPNEVVPRLFRELLAKNGQDWPPSIEVSTLQLIDVYVREGFGVGLTLRVPQKTPDKTVKFLPLAGVRPIPVGALWRGRLSPVAEALLDEIRKQAKMLGGLG